MKDGKLRKVMSWVGTFLAGAGLVAFFYIMYIFAYACQGQ